MGISGLWNLLEPAKDEIYLSECKGQKLAVDLSSWILRCGLVSNSNSMGSPKKEFFSYRGIFFETINISQLGINLIFVMDGPNAPRQKAKTNRQSFYFDCLQYKQLLTDMGFVVLEAKSEAEKMCAELNKIGLVDGVLTEDGDAFVYGAKVVYKGISKKLKVMQASKYTLAKVEETLGMGTRDLVAFALLSGGDLNKGVDSVGEKRFVELFNELKRKNVVDCLTRLQEWKCNTELDDIDDKRQILPKKGSHCKICLHLGTKALHLKSGCHFCMMKIGCLDAKSSSHTLKKQIHQSSEVQSVSDSSPPQTSKENANSETFMRLTPGGHSIEISSVMEPSIGDSELVTDTDIINQESSTSLSQLSDVEGSLHPLCGCPHCEVADVMTKNKLEKKIRQLALKHDNNFPDEEIIRQFLQDENVYPDAEELYMKPPRFRDIHDALKRKLNFDSTKTIKHLIPWTIRSTLNGALTGISLKPLKITKSCTEQGSKCYSVQWARLDLDDLSEPNETSFEVTVAKSVFTAIYPHMSREFEKPSFHLTVSPKASKRKRQAADDPRQPKMSAMFNVVKKISTTSDVK